MHHLLGNAIPRQAVRSVERFLRNFLSLIDSYVRSLKPNFNITGIEVLA